MATLTITNLTNEPILLQELYATLGPGKTLTTERFHDDLHSTPRIQQFWLDGKISVTITNATAETDFIEQKVQHDGAGVGSSLATAAPEDVDKSAALIGTSTKVAREDHKHDVSTAAAVELTDTTNAEGSATSLARSDHQHAHGDRGGGSLHALATTTTAGFMSAADKTKLDSTITQSVRTWAFETVNTGVAYVGGFYDFFNGNNNFSPAITFGQVNRSIAAHFFVVTGQDTGEGSATITVTGTSIDDNGVRTPGDTDTIFIPPFTNSGAYFETKKFNGQVSVESVGAVNIPCNYGWSKYHDNNNQDFTVIGLEGIWLSEATDTASDLALLHHKTTGWTYNAGSTPTPPTAIARRSIDHGAENGHNNGFPGAWKRSNLNVTVAGSAAEGIIVEYTSQNAGVGNQSFRSGTFEVSIESA